MSFFQWFSKGRGHASDEDVQLIKAKLKEIAGDTAPLYVSRCLAAFGQRDYERAMAEVQAGLRENPNHPDLLLWRGNIFFAEYRYAEAVDSFGKTIESNPSCRAAEDAKKMLDCRELALYSGERARFA